ncbi:MAG: hypothetical protein QGF07_01550, partial [Phycisphaerales bacterium]|nr:hypothetical protein [Phycisphaerales bacterium]
VSNSEFRCIIAGGGVIANSLLRTQLSITSKANNLPLLLPPHSLCVDNAAMVAGLGWHLFSNSQFADLELTAQPRGIAS